MTDLEFPLIVCVPIDIKKEVEDYIQSRPIEDLDDPFMDDVLFTDDYDLYGLQREQSCRKQGINRDREYDDVCRLLDDLRNNSRPTANPVFDDYSPSNHYSEESAA